MSTPGVYVARVPTWWVDLGGETAQQLEELFAQVMTDLPVSQKDLSDDLGVAPITLWRWAEGKSTPEPSKMLEAVQKVREHLEQQAHRASAVEQALKHLVEAQDEGDQEAKWEASNEVKELLEEFE